MRAILEGNVAQVIKGLRQTVTKRKLFGAKKKALLVVAAYFYNNHERMRYHEYLAQGLPIASGPVEGACKNLIKDRMERSGMRWTNRWQKLLSGFGLYTSAATSTLTGLFTSSRTNCASTLRAVGPSS